MLDAWCCVMLMCDGLARIRCGTRVSAPSKVFAVRGSIALAHRTVFECLLLLDQERWEWKRTFSKQIADARIWPRQMLLDGTAL